MKSLIKMTLLQWLRSPARVALFLYPSVGLIASLVLAIVMSGTPVTESAMGIASGLAVYFNVVLGVGIVSREREDGVLASIFARPIYRSTYIVSRWLALAIGSWLGVLLFVAFQCAVTLSSTHQLDLAYVMRICAESGLVCLGLSATMVAFSTIAPTYGDICLYLLSWLGTITIMSFASAFSYMSSESELYPLLKDVDVDYLHFIQQGLSSYLFPQVSLEAPRHLWLKMSLTYVSNILTALFIATFLMNKKEISYGG